MSEDVDDPLATEEDERQVVIWVTRDLQNTLGPGYENIAQSNANRLQEFGTVEDYVERVVNAVQQEIHDEFIDTSWPPCPRHPQAPLWFRDGGWWCEHDGELIAALGSLPARRVSNPFPVSDLQFSRPAEHGGPQICLFVDRSIDPFSSDFWMLEGNCIPWMDTLYWLDRVFGHGRLGVSIHYQPWWPGRKSKLSAFKAGMPGTYQEVGGVIAGAVGPPFVPRRFLETRKVCGGPNSGLWLLMVPRPGHSIDYHALATLGGLPIQIAADIRDALLVALTLDEGELGTLLVHRDHPERDRLWELKAWLSAQAR